MRKAISMIVSNGFGLKGTRRNAAERPRLPSERLRASWHSLAVLLVICFFCAPSSRAQSSAAGKPATITGEIQVGIADDFARSRARTHYWVREEASGRTFKVRFARPPGHLRNGQRVTLKGRALGRELRVSEFMSPRGEGPSAASTADALDAPLVSGERRVGVSMVDLLDAKASDRNTLDQIADAMFTGPGSASELYSEVSRSQVEFPADSDGFADVFGPFAINHTATSCDYYDWAYAADAAAGHAGINLTHYQHVVYVMPHWSELSCGWAGLGQLGGSRTWVAGGEYPFLYAHELGHNLYMHHASTDPENDGIVNSEYGDQSDPMGSWTMSFFNAPHNDQMGWLQAYPGKLVSVASNGVYDLYALSLDPSETSGPQVLKIHKPDTNEFYYLSLRQPVGGDRDLRPAYTGGMSVHRYRGGRARTYLIDRLENGEMFEDSVNDIRVEQLSQAADGSHVTVRVLLTRDEDEDGVDDDTDNCLEIANPDQLDRDSDGYGNACDADCTDDDFVNTQDFLQMLSEWAGPGSCDFNDDGVVGARDYIHLSRRWEEADGPSGLDCAGSTPCPSN